MINKEKAYSMLPVYLQNEIISIYGYYWKNRRFGGVFKKELKNFRSRNLLTTEKWNTYQTIQLRKILVHAFDNVPYYQEKYKSIGLKREDLAFWNLSDLKKLPILDKEDLRKFGKTKLMSKIKSKGSYFASSGSTGTPTNIYYSKKFHQTWSAAFEARIREWAGVNRHMARGTIGGRRIVITGDSLGPFYRFNKYERQTYFSAYHIGPKTVENYLKGMIEGKVQYMTGYATANYILAKEIENAGLKAPQLKAVITSSEKLSSKMRATFKRVYGCNSYDSYSGVEACNLISETKDGLLVNSPDVGILELLNSEGQDINLGETGEAICTGLLNFDQPLIRYRIGDRIKLSNPQSTRTEIKMPIISEIVGRIEDKIIGADGRVMVRFHGVFLNVSGLILSQVIQESINWINLKLIVNHEYNIHKSEIVMTKRLRSQLGDDLRVTFEYVKNIPVSSSGKIKSVISKIKK